MSPGHVAACLSLGCAAASGLLVARRAGLRGAHLAAGACLAAFGLVTLCTALAGTVGALRPLPLQLLTIGAAIAAAAACARGSARAGAPPGATLPPSSPLVWIAALAPLALVLLLGRLAAPWGWDRLSHHLPQVFHWEARQDLSVVPVPVFTAYYPANGPLWMTFLHLQSGKLAWLMHSALPFAPALALASASVLRRVEDRAPAEWCALGVLWTPLVLVQAGSGYVDLAFGFYFLSALSFSLGFSRGGGRAELLFASLAAGLLIGTKPTLMLAAPVLLHLAWAMARRLARDRSLLPWYALALLCGLAAGGHWYLRNLARTGNPLFPVSFALGGATFFPGPLALDSLPRVDRWFVSQPWKWLLFPLTESAHGSPRFTVDHGFGPFHLACLAAWPLAAARAWRGRNRPALLVLALWPALVALWWLLFPVHQPRYLLMVAGLAPIALSLALAGLPPRARRAWEGFALVAAAAGLLVSLSSLVPRTERLLQARQAGRPPSAYAYWNWMFPGLGSAAAAAHRGAERPLRILHNHPELRAALAGPGPRMHELVYVSPRPTAYPEVTTAASPAEWLDWLRREKVDRLFLFSPAWDRSYPMTELEWIRAGAERFELLHEAHDPRTGDLYVYRLRGGESAGR